MSWVHWGWAVLLGPGIPSLYAAVAFSLGHTPSIFISDGRQRTVPLVLAALSCSFGTLYLHGQGAPTYVIILMGAYASSAFLASLITWRWTISLHVAGAVVPWLVGLVCVGVLYWALLPVPVIVGWARIRRREHTTGQILAGSLVGAGSTAVGWSLLRLLG